MAGSRPEARKLKCKAKAKSTGKQCNRWAVEGYEVCTVHGAGTKKRVNDGSRNQPGAPIKTGRYADKLRHPAIAALLSEFENDPDPMNLFSELAASRALFINYINQYESYTEALLAWHESWQRGEDDRELKPRQVLDVSDSYRILSETTKIAERIKKMEFLDSIGKRDLGRVMGEMAKIVAKYVPEELTQEAIAKEWREIRI
jgi:hypothetical protein